MLRTAVALTSLTLFVAASPAPLPEDLETDLALSAAPERLRAGASVLHLGGDGYVEARKGTNGFTCLVSRPHPKAMAPMCYDAEGTRTVVPRIKDEATMRAAGQSAEAIAAAVKEGFASGKYQAPQRSGISYMTSAVQELYSPERGIRSFVPHLMFYAPNLTDEDIGGQRGLDGVFMNSTQPHGMIIVPLGEKERAAILAEQAELVAKAKQFLEAQAP